MVSRLPSLEGSETPRLTPVAVEDLLLRSSVEIDTRGSSRWVKGKAVIVTGGGGSIGSEICDRVATFGAARLLVLEHSEPALYAVTEALTRRETGAAIEGRIADIRDRERIMALMAEFKPDIVFHARGAESMCRSSNATGARASRPTSWIGECRRRGAGGWGQGDGDDLDRQGHRAGLRCSA